MIYKTRYLRHCQTVSKAETRVILCVVNLHFADRQFDLCRSTQIGIFRVDQHFDVADQRSPAHTLCPILWKINAPGEDPGSALKHLPSDFSPLFVRTNLVVRPPKSEIQEVLPAQCRIVRELNAARSANNSAECKWVPSQICHRKCFGLKDCAGSSKFKRKTSQWWNDDNENKTNVQLCWAQVNKGKSEKKRWKMEKEKEGGKYLVKENIFFFVEEKKNREGIEENVWR